MSEVKELRKPEDVLVGDKTVREILDAHKHWLYQDCPGWERMRGDLSNTDLSDMDFHGEQMAQIIMDNARVMRSNFKGAVLRRASLSRINGVRAIFDEADLGFADFRFSYCPHASFKDANLPRALMQAADFEYADFTGADLFKAILDPSSNLYHSNVFGTRMKDITGLCGIPDFVNLDKAEEFLVPSVCPQEGSFIAWKKAEVEEYGDEVILKLEIPADARRVSGTGRKCRCDKAKVLEIQDLDGTVRTDLNEACSWYQTGFVYTVGKTVEEPDFNEDRWKECAMGIHFFMDREEAVQYNWT